MDGELTYDLVHNNEHLRLGPSLGGVQGLLTEGPRTLDPGKTRAGFEFIQTSIDGNFRDVRWHVDDPTDARVRFYAAVSPMRTFTATVRIHQK